jgi:import inner membrane translocase subunit TIM23
MASSRPDSQAPSSEDLLRQAKFGAPNSSPASSSSSPAYAPTSDSILYGGAYDPARLHPLSGLNLNKGDDGELDWLDIEDDKLNTLEGTKGLLPNRGWGDELCYGTGTTYLSGQSKYTCLCA